MHGEEGKFVINSTSGIVTTAGALDRETKDSYTVFVATLLLYNKRVILLTVYRIFCQQCSPSSIHLFVFVLVFVLRNVTIFKLQLDRDS